MALSIDDGLHLTRSGYGGKTEWDDALIKHGIKEAPPLLPTEDETQLENLEIYQKMDKLDRKNMDDLDELEDDLEEDVLKKYRERRIAEMKANAEKAKFGLVYHISEKQFVKEVTEAAAAAGVFVVCHLYNGKDECELVNSLRDQLAPKFRAVKFVKIASRECIHNYPDEKCPTLLIYTKGDIHEQIIGITRFGGSSMSLKSFEWGLAALGVLKTELEENPLTKQRMKITRTVGKRREVNDDDDDFNFSSDDDPEV